MGKDGKINVIWNAIIEHFTPDEIDAIMKTIYEFFIGNKWNFEWTYYCRKN